jgi:hypothetical protein
VNRCSKTARLRRRLLTASLSPAAQTSNNPAIKRLAAWGRKIWLQGHLLVAKANQTQEAKG